MAYIPVRALIGQNPVHWRMMKKTLWTQLELDQSESELLFNVVIDRYIQRFLLSTFHSLWLDGSPKNSPTQMRNASQQIVTTWINKRGRVGELGYQYQPIVPVGLILSEVMGWF